jgi:hypothetical protein
MSDGLPKTSFRRCTEKTTTNPTSRYLVGKVTWLERSIQNQLVVCGSLSILICDDIIQHVLSAGRYGNSR